MVILATMDLYRSGTFLTRMIGRAGSGVTLGRNLIVNKQITTYPDTDPKYAIDP